MSLTIEHLKSQYLQLPNEDLGEYYQRLHKHARELKIIQIRTSLRLLGATVPGSTNYYLKVSLEDLVDLVEDLI